MIKVDDVLNEGPKLYARYQAELEKENQEREMKQQAELEAERKVIRDALIPHIGSLVEFVDLENMDLDYFSKGSYQYNWFGRGVMIRLPDAAPIKINLYFTRGELVILGIDNSTIVPAKEGDAIFNVGYRCRIDDDVTDPTAVWEYWNGETDTHSFSDIYLAVGCALAHGHLEKEAWEQYNRRIERKAEHPKPEPKTWKNTLVEAIIDAVQEEIENAAY